jgi:hypothetical protein
VLVVGGPGPGRHPHRLLGASGEGGRLDPSPTPPAGSRALAELLRAEGVQVDRVDTVEAVVAADRTDTTVVVPFPQGLARSEVELLADLAAPLVVIGAQQPVLDVLEAPVDAGPVADVERRQPACLLPAAERAGDADLGGQTYEAEGVQAVGCYSTRGRAPLLVVPSEGLTLIGDGRPLTNERLDDRGNAALAVGLLSRTNRVVWLVPRPGRRCPRASSRRCPRSSPTSSRPARCGCSSSSACSRCGAPAGSGRVVEEPLPVVVRAAEAVEGRSRLYRAAGARGSAPRRCARPPASASPPRRHAAGRRPRRPWSSGWPERAVRDPAVVDALLYGGPQPTTPRSCGSRTTCARSSRP